MTDEWFAPASVGFDGFTDVSNEEVSNDESRRESRRCADQQSD
jgi:hypothetical protein